MVFATDEELTPAAAELGASAGPVGPLSGWRADLGAGEITLVRSGVGAAAAAAVTAAALAGQRFDLAVCAGVAGGFGEMAGRQLVVADLIVAADLGAESGEGFLDGATFGAACKFRPPAEVVEVLAARAVAAGLSVGVGPVLTVSTVTGTTERADLLLARHRAAAEAMEGAGVAQAAALLGRPVAEIRAVCNAVGPRDRGSWRFAEAVSDLARGLGAVLAEPLPLGLGIPA